MGTPCVRDSSAVFSPACVMHSAERLSSSICGAFFTTIELAGKELIFSGSRLGPMDSTSCIPGLVPTASAMEVNTDSRPFCNVPRSEEHTSELQSQFHLVCRLLLEKKKK